MDNPFVQALSQCVRHRVSILAFEARNTALDAVVMAAAVGLILAAVGSADAALWLMLAPRIGAAGAALSSSVALLLVGGFVLWARQRRLHRKISGAQIPAPATPDLADAAMQTFGANKFALLISAFAAGAAAARANGGK